MIWQSAPRHERTLILLFCALAGLRISVFSAAFPFFNNVDEQAHVDLVIKYADGDVPRELGHYSSESAYYFALYGTPEYLKTPGHFGNGPYPPPKWTLPEGIRKDLITRISGWWVSNRNHESGEPPLYYAVAGLWLNVGSVLGLSGAWLLYWIRFLNVVAGSVLVWIGFVAAKQVFPGSQFMRVSVALLLALWPQTTFYSIASDSLSPICYGIAFIGLLKMMQADRPSLTIALWTGLALAATCLVKTANFPLLLAACIVLLVKVFNSGGNAIGRLLASLAVMATSAALPVAFWLSRNLHTFGDLTATESKINLLGWTRKQIGDWFSHPVFTVRGMGEFWPELIASFWRGEFVWHGVRLSSPMMDKLFWISSTFAILLTPVFLVRRVTNSTALQRQALWLALSNVAVLILFLVGLSIAYDFGPGVYPSREHPYFTSGRLLSAAAIPFFLIYAYALDRVLPWTPSGRLRWSLLAGIALLLAAAQCLWNSNAFASQYNLFHLPEWS